MLNRGSSLTPTLHFFFFFSFFFCLHSFRMQESWVADSRELSRDICELQLSKAGACHHEEPHPPLPSPFLSSFLPSLFSLPPLPPFSIVPPDPHIDLPLSPTWEFTDACVSKIKSRFITHQLQPLSTVSVFIKNKKTKGTKSPGWINPAAHRCHEGSLASLLLCYSKCAAYTSESCTEADLT